MKAKYLLVGFGVLLLISSQLIRQENELAPAPSDPFFNGTFPDSVGTWEFQALPGQNAFGLLMWIQTTPSGKFWVTVRGGEVWEADFSSGSVLKKQLLDIKDITYGRGDGGLFDLELHPEFGEADSPNRNYIYLAYNHLPARTFNKRDEYFSYHRVSRFTFDPEGRMIDPQSEMVLIQQFDRDWLHSGGSMFFDNEGFLNISIGDEGDTGDYEIHGQRIDHRLYGGILRIDVDMDSTKSHPPRRTPNPVVVPEGWPQEKFQNYFIPNSNPWQDPTGNNLEEFVVIGLRNPHSTYYDSEKDEIWVGDVGAAAREELSVMKRGDNGQWPYREGSLDGPRPKPQIIVGRERPPIFDYGRDFGQAIIAGFLYKGEKHSGLKEKFIFGDFSTNDVWAFDRRDSSVQHLVNLTVDENTLGMTSFTEGPAGEILATHVQTDLPDRIVEIRRKETVELNLPETLSELGAFVDLTTLKESNHFIPYSLNSEFYSDNALKRRWVSIPNDGVFDAPNEQVVIRENQDLDFPVGTVFIKHFDIPTDLRDPSKTRRLETRFLVLTSDQSGYGLTYKWNEEGTDAFLLKGELTESMTILNENGVEKQFHWTYPSRQQCMTCHRREAGFVLGPQLHNLSKSHLYGEVPLNQVSAWNGLNIFSESLSQDDIISIKRTIALDDPVVDKTLKVRSYLDTNCSFCHRRNNTIEAAFDAQFSTPLSEANLLDTSTEGRQSLHENSIVASGDTTRSELLRRIQAIDGLKMPPLGRNQVDTTFEKVLKEWILKADLLTPVTSMPPKTSIYPNPLTDNQITITTENLEPFELRIQDLSGKIFFSRDEVRDGQINLPTLLKPGIYIFTLNFKNQNSSIHRLIKK